MLIAFLTFPGFFVFNPFETDISVLSFVQFFSLIGAFLALIFAIWFRSYWKLALRFKFLFWLSLLSWPASLVLVRAVSFLAWGDPGFDYLLRYPIFILTDAVFPIAVMFFWFREKQFAGTRAPSLISRDEVSE